MMMIPKVVVCIALSLWTGCDAFAGKNGRVFVGTPVSDWPKKLGKWQRAPDLGCDLTLPKKELMKVIILFPT